MNQRKPSLHFDVAVIGGGSAGYAAARTTAAAGLKVVVIDGAPELGGLCILRGCMPTKALLQSAEVLHMVSQAAEFGVRTGRVSFDFQRVQERKAKLIREFADYRRGQLTDGPFSLRRSTACFMDPHTVELADGQRVTAAYFVITTGSRVVLPPVPGLAEAKPLVSDDALELKRPPKSLILLGGGAVAVEFAQFFARFGTRVTVIQRSGQVLKDFDTEAARALESALTNEGLRLFTGTRLLDVRVNRRGKEVRFEQEGKLHRVAAEEILVALGRVPNTDSLGLEQARVATDKGRILTDTGMRTSAPHIFAGGDCTSPYELVHLAVMQGEVAGHNIARPGRQRTLDDRLLIQVIFTEPQVALVGLTEKAAKARGIEVLAASYPFDDHGKSMILGATDGFVKLLADPQSGEILGGCCVGPQGGELIHEIVAAMAQRTTVAELAALPHYHPTLAEIWTYPAEELAEQISRAKCI